MNKLIGQHMLIGVSGHTLTNDEKKFIIDNNISGVVLFDRNIAEPKQLRDLCAELQSLRHKQQDKAPLFIGIDMEGGRVARLKEPFTIWPPLKKLGDLDAPTVSFHMANRMGQELKSVGINLDFAPCVDVFTNPKNTVIGDRSISTDPEMVAKHASALVRGYIKSEVMSCAKHFPGHGNTLVDSHEDLPVEELDKARLDACELIPFKKSFKARVEMVMTAHVMFPKIDDKWPVTMSEIFLKKILRDEMRYRGLIITDDLDMKALANHYDKDTIAVRSLQAGADLILYCNEAESPARALETILTAVAQGQISKESLQQTHARILSVKKESLLNPDPMPYTEAQKIIGNPEHKKISEAIASGIVPDGLIGE